MKKILITGCSTGFGFQAAKYLAEKGHLVVATMRNTNGTNKDSAESLKKYAAEKNLKIDVVDLDVTSDESIKAAMIKIPTVDVLINNAGRGFGGAIETFTSKELAYVKSLSRNYISYFLV